MIEKSPLFILAADNFGYFGRGEPRFRRGESHKLNLWGGCSAGISTIGVTSDGAVRGCLSMPPSMNEGSVRQRPLSEIWADPKAFSYSRRFSIDILDKNCRECALGQMCRAGCRSLALAVTGEMTHNPYCLRHLADQKR